MGNIAFSFSTSVVLGRWGNDTKDVDCSALVGTCAQPISARPIGGSLQSKIANLESEIVPPGWRNWQRQTWDLSQRLADELLPSRICER
jgi:hypothetical protein